MVDELMLNLNRDNSAPLATVVGGVFSLQWFVSPGNECSGRPSEAAVLQSVPVGGGGHQPSPPE